MPLFLVTVSSTAVVVADNADDAYQVAQDHVRDIISDDCSPNIDVEREVTALAHLDGGWDAMCIPYGGDGNTRTGELLGAASTPQPPAPPTDHP